MVAPVPYLHFAGEASQALRTYQEIFGGEVRLFTFAEFNRTDGDPDLVAHGELHGPVELSAADIVGDQPTTRVEA